MATCQELYSGSEYMVGVLIRGREGVQIQVLAEMFQPLQPYFFRKKKVKGAAPSLQKIQKKIVHSFRMTDGPFPPP